VKRARSQAVALVDAELTAGSSIAWSEGTTAAVVAEGSDRSPAAADLVSLRDLPTPSDRILQRLYGLSPAEVRIAQGISRGDSLGEVAASTGIRITTARTHLASIFEKTNTRRQAKLVAILRHLVHIDSFATVSEPQRGNC
jgi:DNA-binding CsgD family transcriptional regulator